MDGRMPLDLPADGQGIRIHRPVFKDVPSCLFLQLRKPLKLHAAAPCRLAIARKIRPILHRENGKLLIRVIRQLPVLIQQLVQRLAPEALHAGLQGQFRILSARVHRVKLDAARLADKIQRALFTGKSVFSQQAVMQQDEAAGLTQGERQHSASPLGFINRTPSGTLSFSISISSAGFAPCTPISSRNAR